MAGTPRRRVLHHNDARPWKFDALASGRQNLTGSKLRRTRRLWRLQSQPAESESTEWLCRRTSEGVKLKTRPGQPRPPFFNERVSVCTNLLLSASNCWPSLDAIFIRFATHS